jgi:hypothetical protein
MEISPFRRDLPLLDAMPVPFWEVTLARDMRRFGASLGLTPNIAGTPSVNLAAAIIFGRRSFEAVLRQLFDNAEFRNLRNYALGKVKTPRALGSVLAKCGGNQEIFEELIAVLRDPDSANSVRFVGALEGAAYRLATFIRSVPAPCPCCGANLVRSAEDWWREQLCDVGMMEAHLVDRACMVAIATHVLIGFRDDAKTLPPPVLHRLQMHPNANWLQSLARLVGAPTLSNLAPRVGAEVTTETVLRVARGDTLTAEVVSKLIAERKRTGALKAALIPTRTLAFAIDFLSAANRSGELDDETARKIVAARVDALIADVIIVAETRGGRLRPAALAP